MTLKCFPYYRPLVVRIHWSLVDFPPKGLVIGALRSSWLLAGTNCWTNIWHASDLRCHSTYCISAMLYYDNYQLTWFDKIFLSEGDIIMLLEQICLCVFILNIKIWLCFFHIYIKSYMIPYAYFKCPSRGPCHWLFHHGHSIPIENLFCSHSHLHRIINMLCE